MKDNTLLFVTGNKNKIQEAQSYLPDYIIKSAGVNIDEIQSIYVIDVIKAKLRAAFEATGKPCFVMDASLIIDGLCDQKIQNPEFPWALIKDVFSNMGAENITKIVSTNNNHNCQ